LEGGGIKKIKNKLKIKTLDLWLINHFVVTMSLKYDARGWLILLDGLAHTNFLELWRYIKPPTPLEEVCWHLFIAFTNKNPQNTKLVLKMVLFLNSQLLFVGHNSKYVHVLCRIEVWTFVKNIGHVLST
jgi:hypothetical protein